MHCIAYEHEALLEHLVSLGGSNAVDYLLVYENPRMLSQMRKFPGNFITGAQSIFYKIDLSFFELAKPTMQHYCFFCGMERKKRKELEGVNGCQIDPDYFPIHFNFMAI